MDWLEIAAVQTEAPSFKKIQKITLHDHNSVLDFDQSGLHFHCLLNCKRLNRLYSTICQIQGDFQAGQISINCHLLDQQRVVGGEWNYQRIELSRFAFRYNERSYRNIFIRAHPLTGSVSVTLCFLSGPSILEDEQKFRETMSDLCHLVGEESEMIFNTMLEIILGREANEPYLKSGMKVNPGFPRYMKVEKLLDKIKSLIATSSFYKIRSDISSAHKNRSHFKKIYLNQEKKLESHFKIRQMALAYELKFHKRHEETDKRPRERQFIKDYIELEEKNEIQFAKHLNEGAELEYTQPAAHKQPLTAIRYDQTTRIYELQLGPKKIHATGCQLSQKEYSHELAILELIGKRHPNMSEYFIPLQPPKQLQGWVFYRWEEEVALCDYLRRNSRTISLATKLHIMTQVCSLLQYLHKRNIGYFIQVENIYITRGLEVRIRGFGRCYSVAAWVDPKDKKERKEKEKNYKEADPTNIILDQSQFRIFPYRYIVKEDLDNEKCDVMSLAVSLYRILMGKFPFDEHKLRYACSEHTRDQWERLWTVETEYFRSRGGQIVKIIAHLLLKCLDIETITNRPYVEWLLVILCEIRTSLNGLY